MKRMKCRKVSLRVCVCVCVCVCLFSFVVVVVCVFFLFFLLFCEGLVGGGDIVLVLICC